MPNLVTILLSAGKKYFKQILEQNLCKDKNDKIWDLKIILYNISIITFVNRMSGDDLPVLLTTQAGPW